MLKARQKLPFTIELLFLDGEEAVGEWRGTDNTYGSRHYVDSAQKTGSLKSIKALILLDMIGDRSLNIRRDIEFHAVAHRHRLGHRPTKLGHAAQLPRRADDRSRTTTCRS